MESSGLFCRNFFWLSMPQEKSLEECPPVQAKPTEISLMEIVILLEESVKTRARAEMKLQVVN